MNDAIKGYVLASRLTFVLERLGAAKLDKILSILPHDDQLLLRAEIKPGKWYPFSTSANLDDAILTVMGDASEDAMRELGRQSASRNLEKFQGAFIKNKTPFEFLMQAPAIYRMYYNTGWREFEPTGPKKGELITHDAENVTVADCYTVMGWYEKALELVGAKSPRLTHPECRARGGIVCRYEVSWK